VTVTAAILLGIVQGLTEFLPVSSSAHLILARAFFGWDAGQAGLAFDVACHAGTLAAVIAYFWRDLVAMAAALPRAFVPRPSGAARRIHLIVIGTIPVVVVAVLGSSLVERTLRTPLVAAVSLALIAFVFFAVERIGSQQRDEPSLSLGDAALLGCAQAAALVPGVSRSGATIAAAMAMGVRRDEAARFTFLLGVPAILAAAAKEGVELTRHGLPPGEGSLFAAGAVASAVVGYLTVRFLIRYLARHSLRPFAWYRLALAASVLAWWLSGVPFRG
jgi:undecaprenyl-diphosphatase